MSIAGRIIHYNIRQQETEDDHEERVAMMAQLDAHARAQQLLRQAL